MLDIYAGRTAKKVLAQHGWQQAVFDIFLGASGGPKWFVLAGLDGFFTNEFFANRTRPLHLLGSSIGAYRCACYAQQNPGAAIARLAESYVNTRYQGKPSRQEITLSCLSMLDEMLSGQGSEQILTNPVFKLHISVARCLGLTRSENLLLQGAGLALSAGANLLGRRNLRLFYQRQLFSVGAPVHFSDQAAFKTHYSPLNKHNLPAALLASGAIPMAIEGVKNIHSAPAGMYRDGGIVDYHFDLALGEGSADNSGGLVLYPHFYPYLVPGWFDKNLNRRASSASVDKMVLLAPSKDFVASLPYGKIPDRTDFSNIDTDKRIAYWQEVVKRSEQLVDAYHHWLAQPDWLDKIKPL